MVGCFDARFFPGQERAGWHTLEQKEHSATRAGLRFKKQQERLESCGVRREHRRRGRRERTRRNRTDMAGVKTFDLLVGVVLVLHCVRNVHAEIPTGNGKNKLQQRGRCACTELQVAGGPSLSVTGGFRHENKLRMRDLIPWKHHMELCFKKHIPMSCVDYCHYILIIFSRLVFHHFIMFAYKSRAGACLQRTTYRAFVWTDCARMYLYTRAVSSVTVE